MTPEEAFDRATHILVEQYNGLLLEEVNTFEPEETEDAEVSDKAFAALPARTRKALGVIGVTNMTQLSQYSEDELGALDGMGEKAAQGIKKALAKEGLSLK